MFDVIFEDAGHILNNYESKGIVSTAKQNL